MRSGGFAADVSAETLARTNLSGLRAGDRVNLEKSLRLGDFVGGHIVLGHVDGLGRIFSRKVKSGSVIFGIETEEQLGRHIVEKGSIAVDGISLTVNECQNSRFYVNIIPHTAGETTLGFKKAGDRVNIETDILGKYVEKLLQKDQGEGGVRKAIDLNFLAEHGYIK
jgi:riboflavin synthase